MKLLASFLKFCSGVQTGAERDISRLEHGAQFCGVAKSFVANVSRARGGRSLPTLLALNRCFALALSVTSSLLKKEGENRDLPFHCKFVAM